MSVPASSFVANSLTPSLPPAVWTESQAIVWLAEVPGGALALDANHRPHTPLYRPADVERLGPQLRLAVADSGTAALRGALARRGIAVLDAFPPPPSPASGELAEQLLAMLEVVAAAQPGGALVGIGTAGGDATEEFELAVRPLDGLHPLTVLAAFAAPSNWSAIGAVCSGRRIAPKSDDEPAPVRTAHIVTRSNHEARWIEIDGERIAGPGLVQGRIPDGLRRALGLATAPPCAPTDVLFAEQWLAAVVRTGATTMEAAAALHPALRILPAGSATPADLVEAARALGRVCGWDDVRERIGDGRLPGSGFDPAFATWMDAGMLSREMLGLAPDLRDGLAAVHRTCGAKLAGAIEAVLDSLGLSQADLERWHALTPI